MDQESPSPALPEVSEAALGLLHCIEALAQEQTNPVLLLLRDVARLEAGRRYPQESLLLMGDRWRCFYHCHDSPAKSPEEHGHFHFFAACGDGTVRRWTHVAALSMDQQGQPLCWFTVNRWVTDGPWVAAQALGGLLHWQQVGEKIPLLQRWLSLAAQFYAGTILDLLSQRDHKLMEIKPASPQADILEDRKIYLLSRQQIDLRADLTATLTETDGMPG